VHLYRTISAPLRRLHVSFYTHTLFYIMRATRSETRKVSNFSCFFLSPCVHLYRTISAPLRRLHVSCYHGGRVKWKKIGLFAATNITLYKLTNRLSSTRMRYFYTTNRNACQTVTGDVSTIYSLFADSTTVRADSVIY